MIEHLKGILIQKTPTFIVVECNGVGYGVNISAYTASKLPTEGSEVSLHTQLIVREDSMTLFGFFEVIEKEVFLMLLNVNGVGPKMGQRILSGVSPIELLNMIANENKSALGKIKGLGKKTCEQMTLTLKDKTIKMLNSIDNPQNNSFVITQNLNGAKLEAVLALHTLGIKDPIAEKVVLKASEILGDAVDAATLIPEALKYV